MIEKQSASPFFSVLVPVYNVENYVSACIDSVMHQTYKDYELVLVDDGSTDASGAICDAYAERFGDRIRVTHQENQGLLMARRSGIKAAQGRYLIFLDSDDMLKDDALEVIARQCEADSVDIVLYNASRKADYSVPFRDYARISGTFDNKVELLKKLCGGDELNNMCMKAIHRRIVDTDADYSPYKAIKMGEDLLQCLPLFDRAQKIVITNQALYFYRDNSLSMCATWKQRDLDTTALLYGVLDAYARKWSEEYGFDFARLATVRELNVYAEQVKTAAYWPVCWREKKARYLAIDADAHFASAYETQYRAGLSLANRMLLRLLRKHRWICLRVISSICRIRIKNRQ